MKDRPRKLCKRCHRTALHCTCEPKPDDPRSLERVVSRLLRRFKLNGALEIENSNLCRRKGRAILAHEATLRSGVWFCAANVIEEELAANSEIRRGDLSAPINPQSESPSPASNG